MNPMLLQGPGFQSPFLSSPLGIFPVADPTVYSFDQAVGEGSAYGTQEGILFAPGPILAPGLGSFPCPATGPFLAQSQVQVQSQTMPQAHSPRPRPRSRPNPRPIVASDYTCDFSSNTWLFPDITELLSPQDPFEGSLVFTTTSRYHKGDDFVNKIQAPGHY